MHGTNQPPQYPAKPPITNLLNGLLKLTVEQIEMSIEMESLLILFKNLKQMKGGRNR
jgi:hypothetical protein